MVALFEGKVESLMVEIRERPSESKEFSTLKNQILVISDVKQISTIAEHLMVEIEPLQSESKDLFGLKNPIVA
jgi:hypothetical protein